MKRLLGVVSMVALVGAVAPVQAAPQTALLDAGAVAVERAQALEAFYAIQSGVAKDSTQLIAALGGKLTPAQAANLFALAKPAADAAIAKKIVLSAKDREAIATNVKESGLIAAGAMKSLAATFEEHGNVNALAAEIAETASSDIGLVSPSVVAGLPASEVLVRYSPITEEGKQALAERAETAEGEANLAEALQTALVEGAANCSSGNVSHCLRLTRTATELWGANGFHNKGPKAKSFHNQAMKAFPGEENRAPGEQYWSGMINAETGILAAKDQGVALPEEYKQVNNCLEHATAL